MPIQYISDEVIRKKADIVVTLYKKHSNSRGCDKADEQLNDIPYTYYFSFTVVSAAYYSFYLSEDSTQYDTIEDYIKGCYRTILLNAADYAYNSVELPLIWFPELQISQEKVARIASEVILEFLDCYDMDVTVVLPVDRPIHLDSKQLDDLREIVHSRYIPPAKVEGQKDNLTKTQKIIEKMLLDGNANGASELVRLNSLDELMSRKDEPFSNHLFRMIDSKGMTDSEVYKGALIDRKLFSKIRNVNNYTPRKGTILALAVSMMLTLDETQDLLQSAGYSLSDSSETDIIVGYFIDNNIFDIFKINEALYSFGLKGLGSTAE